MSPGQGLAAEDVSEDPALAYATDAAGETPALEAIGKVTGAAADVAPVPKAMSTALRVARDKGEALAGQTVSAGRERECLAIAIYFEARGEVRQGQVAVAQVVLNRVRSPRYPDTICNVVYQNMHLRNACQFSFACDGTPDKIAERRAWARAKAIAEEVTAGKLLLTNVAGATNYHASYVSPYWAPSMRRLAKIGQHIFYRG
jgi:spore germination cell wall hydrolase CwlJ-like protein